MPWRIKGNKIKFKEHQYGKDSVMKRPDQGLLHPKLEVPAGLTCPGRGPPRWEARTQEKSHLNPLVNSEHLHMYMPATALK